MGSLASKHLDRLDLEQLDLDQLKNSPADGAAVSSAALTEFAVGASLGSQDRALAEDPWEAGLAAAGSPGGASSASPALPGSTTPPRTVAQALGRTIDPPPTSAAPATPQTPPLRTPAAPAAPQTAPPPTGTVPAAPPAVAQALPSNSAPPPTRTTPTGDQAIPAPPPPTGTVLAAPQVLAQALGRNIASPPQPASTEAQPLPSPVIVVTAPAAPQAIAPPPTGQAAPVSVPPLTNGAAPVGAPTGTVALPEDTAAQPRPPQPSGTQGATTIDTNIATNAHTNSVTAAIATAVLAAAAKPPAPPIPPPAVGRSPGEPVPPGLAASPPTDPGPDPVAANSVGSEPAAPPLGSGVMGEPVAEPISEPIAAPSSGSLAEEPDNGETGAGSDLLEQLQTLLIGPEVDELETRLAAIETSLGNPAEMAALLGPDLSRLAAQQVQRTSQSLYQAVSRAVYRTLTSKIDEAIYQRGHEDIDAMSRALAAVLPAAIQREIEQAPSAIAHALGPEIAAAIERQIQVNRGAISDALASEIGLAMKRQIEIERDAMVDALYPVIGSTISKYMQEAVQEINNKVSQAMTLQGFQRKLKAKFQGVSEAELILSESLGFTVTAVFLIHKASGLPIAEVQAEDQNLETELLAGMLTAIRSFANDCIARADTSEISEIDYGNSRILLEVAGYCYLAAIVRGTQPRWYVERMRRVLSGLVLRFDREISNYDGDPATVPTAVQTQLDRLLLNTSSQPKVKGFPLVQWLVGSGVVLLLAGWGWNSWRSAAALRAESAVEQAWYQAPTLSVYGLSAKHEGDRLHLLGRVPSPWLRQEAERVAAAALSQKGIDRPLQNEIVAVEVPPPPEQTRAEVERLVARLAPGGRLRAEYQPDLSPTPGSAPAGTVRLRGQFRDRAEAAALVAALAKLPGVRAVLPNAAIAPSPSDLRIYFVANSAILAGADPAGKIAAIARQLYASPQSTLTIIGYSPPEEAPGDRLPVARQRAETVRAALIAQGVGGDRLRVEGRATRPIDVPAGAAAWESHCVAFELQVNEP